MRLTFLITFLLGLATYAQDASANRPLILITSFDGFNGDSVNHSNLVSHSLVPLLNERFEVSECLLPTLYDVSFEHALDCLKTLPKKPDLIISIGEGSRCHNVELETTVRNTDHATIRDNAGIMRFNHTIIPNELESKPLVFFNDQTPSLLDHIKEIRFDSNMGNFVCNNLAFQMTTYLENYSIPRIPYTFIHVPPHQCRKGLGVSGSAQAISKLLLNLNFY